MKTIIFLAMLLTCGGAGASSVVLGRAQDQAYVKVDTGCPADSVCMNAWFRFRLRITQTLSGQPIAGRIRAARKQDGHYNAKYLRSLRLFVLTPIDDPEKRKLLKAEYYLEDFSPLYSVYCPNKLKLGAALLEKIPASVGDRKECFSINSD